MTGSCTIGSSPRAASRKWRPDRKRGGEGKRGDLGGRRIIKKKKITKNSPGYRRRTVQQRLRQGSPRARCRVPCVVLSAGSTDATTCCVVQFFFFFFKQKTAYEIPKRDWSSDVCSSDLGGGDGLARAQVDAAEP